MTTQPTVFHIDDDPLIRRSLSLLFQSVGLRMESYGSVRDFLEACDPDRPGCLVLDLCLPDRSGLEGLRDCAGRGIHLPVVILTGHGDVSVAVESMKLGAVDFIEKPCSDRALLDAVQQALRLDNERRQERARHQHTARCLPLLSPGERDVLRLLLAGKCYKSIAVELSISYKTVEARRARIMQKMECETLAQLLSSVLAYHYWSAARPPGETAASAASGLCSA